LIGCQVFLAYLDYTSAKFTCQELLQRKLVIFFAAAKSTIIGLQSS